jgi:hypothetical protein
MSTAEGSAVVYAEPDSRYEAELEEVATCRLVPDSEVRSGAATNDSGKERRRKRRLINEPQSIVGEYAMG